MKRIYFIFILLFGVWGTPRAQESTENYIRTRTMLDEQSSSCLDEIMYYDGLGRPYQKMQKGITTNKQNLISLQEYDAAGREYNAWLPIASSSEHMTNATFKSTAPGKYENDSRPYSQPVYEASALNRPIRQYGPGVAWKDSPVSTAYLTMIILHFCVVFIMM